jgi:hypothetical protein
MFALDYISYSLTSLVDESDLIEINPNCEDKEPFDSSFSFLHWIRSCKNGMGLLEHDINNLTCNFFS